MQKLEQTHALQIITISLFDDDDIEVIIHTNQHIATIIYFVNAHIVLAANQMHIGLLNSMIVHFSAIIYRLIDKINLPFRIIYSRILLLQRVKSLKLMKFQCYYSKLRTHSKLFRL